MTAKGTPTTVRLTRQGRTLLRRLSSTLGVTQSAILEIAIREKAKREGLTTKTEESRA